MALDRPMLGPSTTCPAAGLPGTGDKAGEESKQQMTQVEKYENFDKDCFQTKPGPFDANHSRFFFFIVVFLLSFLVFSVNTLYSLVAEFLNSLSIYEIQPVQRD